MFCTLGIITLGFIIGISCDSCSNITCPSIPQHYRELGCISQKSESDCCETRFDCQDFKSLDTNKCHYKGQEYDVGIKAPVEFHDACETSCFCQSGSPLGSPAHFECTDFIECSEPKEFDLNYCVQQYKPGVCCPEIKCLEPIQELGVCQLDGEIYKTGDTMNPKSFPCYTCVCSDNFDNTTVVDNPECTPVNCDFGRSYIHYFQMGCVPLYFQNYGCCTVAFRCPNEKDVIKSNDGGEVAETNTDWQCKFGNLTLNVGDELDINDPCVSCKCDTPPFLHCNRRTNCFIQTNQKNEANIVNKI